MPFNKYTKTNQKILIIICLHNYILLEYMLFNRNNFHSVEWFHIFKHLFDP